MKVHTEIVMHAHLELLNVQNNEEVTARATVELTQMRNELFYFTPRKVLRKIY